MAISMSLIVPQPGSDRGVKFLPPSSEMYTKSSVATARVVSSLYSGETTMSTMGVSSPPARASS
ncbi:hypothetical protein ES708_29690 [subsurface metagenome]